MSSVLLVIHMFLALAIIGLVLLQRSEGGGLGIGGSGGLGGLATPQGTANILSRTTAICAAGFFATSLALGAIAGHHSSGSILDKLDTPAAAVGSAASATPIKDDPKVTPNSPETPATNTAPKAEGEENAVNDNKDTAKDTTKKTTKDITKDTGPKTPSAPISE